MIQWQNLDMNKLLGYQALGKMWMRERASGRVIRVRKEREMPLMMPRNAKSGALAVEFQPTVTLNLPQ